MRKTRLSALAALLWEAGWLAALGQTGQKPLTLKQEMEQAAQKQMTISQQLLEYGTPTKNESFAPAANLFGTYRSLFSHPFETGAGSETFLESTNRSLGLHKAPSGFWSRSDEHGTVTVYASVRENTAHFSASFSLHTPEPLGDAVLAALIAKAEEIKLGTTADEIRIRLARYNLSDGAHTGTRDEWWTFHLSGRLLEETEVLIDWK